jgi:hypothetical protein
VFSNIDVIAVNDYQVIVIAANSSMPDKEVLERRASALQERYRFRYPLPQILSQRLDPIRAMPQSGDLLTDDFAPVELYDTLR